jgi:hypothetical protein
VQAPQNKVIDQGTKDLIDKLLLEKIPLAGITRVTGVSEPWLQSYVNAKYEAVPKLVKVGSKKRGVWQFSVMKCGHLWATKPTSSGFGSLSTLAPAKLWGFMSVTVVEKGLWDCEHRFLLYIDNVLLPTPIFGQLMSRSFLASGIKQLVRRRGKPATLSDSTAPLGNACLA